MKSPRGQIAVRSAAIAFALTSIGHPGTTFADDQFILTSGGIWSNPASWNSGAPPGAGTIADIYIPVTVTYNLTSVANAVIFGPVQLAGNTSNAQLTLNSTFGTPYLDAAGLYVGGSYTGNGGLAGVGPGKVVQSAGTVKIEGGGYLAVDPTSTYNLSSTGSISAYNEQLGGVFTQAGTSNNAMAGGFGMLNFGSYTLTGGTLSADTINNSVVYNNSNGVTYNGVFNQSSGVIQGTSAVGSFINNAAYIYSGGTFSDAMTNNVGATININSATIPFIQGVLNNGRMTVTAPNSSSGTFAGAISGTVGTLLFNGGSTSTVTLTGTSNFSGQTTVAAGTVVLAGPTGTPTSGIINGGITISPGAVLVTNSDYQMSATTVFTDNGAVLNLNGHNESIGSLTINGGGQINQSGGVGNGLQVTTGQITIGKASANINSGLQSGNPLNFNIASNGTLAVSGSLSGLLGSPTTAVVTGGGQLSLIAGSLLSGIDVQQGIVSCSEGGSFYNSSCAVTVESAGSFSIGSQTVTTGVIAGSGTIGLGTGLLNVNVPANTSTTFAGTINGNGSLTKLGTGTLVLTGADSSAGTNTVSAGVLTIAPTGSMAGFNINVQSQATANFYGVLINVPSVSAQGTVNFEPGSQNGILVRNIASLTIGSAGRVNLVPTALHTNRTLLYTASLTMAGNTGNWSGQVDVANNDISVHNGSLSNISDQLKSGFANGAWTGTGIISSTAAADTTHLTALGAILNDDGQGNQLYSSSSSLGLFDGTTPGVTDVLIKYTYFGDTNLDGKVDGSDYSRIDAAFVAEGFVNGVASNPISGWYNGDFNYSGTVDGSDYTLIDNAYNTQGSNLSTTAELARVTAQIAAVPEPASLAFTTLTCTCLALRRRKRHNPSPCQSSKAMTIQRID